MLVSLDWRDHDKIGSHGQSARCFPWIGEVPVRAVLLHNRSRDEDAPDGLRQTCAGSQCRIRPLPGISALAVWSGFTGSAPFSRDEARPAPHVSAPTHDRAGRAAARLDREGSMRPENGARLACGQQSHRPARHEAQGGAPPGAAAGSSVTIPLAPVVEPAPVLVYDGHPDRCSAATW